MLSGRGAAAGSDRAPLPFRPAALCTAIATEVRTTMRFCVIGNGAMGVAHLKALANIPGMQVTALASRTKESTEEVAKKYNVPFWTTDFDAAINRKDVDAVILTSPTQVHADQTEACLKAGKHVLIEIPMADSIADAERIVRLQKETGLICMAGHVRRFNPGHQWVHKKIAAGELNLQQLQAHTYFFRRKNMNALGQPRSWVDHLLWHHACHTVDLFIYQTGEVPSQAYAVQGPLHPELGIAMDMGIVLKAPSGAICTLSLSFNNDGPIGSPFRYICDNGTYIAFYDDLSDGHGNKIDTSKVDASQNGFENQDREFIAAIQEKRQPISSVEDALRTMRVLGKLEDLLNENM
jgi:2-hydroxy-4-carboxymuconate semialdehyde hemiacetal dehydrogenase